MPPRKDKEEKLVVKEKVVKYIGMADVRVIYKTEWAQIGIDQETVRWDKTNGYTVPVDDLSEAALQYCQNADRELVVVET